MRCLRAATVVWLGCGMSRRMSSIEEEKRAVRRRGGAVDCGLGVEARGWRASSLDAIVVSSFLLLLLLVLLLGGGAVVMEGTRRWCGLFGEDEEEPLVLPRPVILLTTA